VVFSSHFGRQYSDSPKYVYEELRRSGLPYRPIWVYVNSKAGYPKDATLVRRGSLAYFTALARAEFWVDNQGVRPTLPKRPGTTYVQTWHGSAFKHMGFDKPSNKIMTRAARRAEQRATDRFDYFVVRSEHDVRTLVPALGVSRAKLLRTGYPRNDALVDGGLDVSALRERLALPADRKVVLYAPTFRHDDQTRREFDLPFDLERFAAELGDTHVLLVRTHYLNFAVLPPGVAHAVRDVSRHPDVTELMLLADALVTDYSSVMFDFALLDRPLVFHVPDYDDYVRHGRGAYFDLAEKAPGPLTHVEKELFAALRELDGNAVEYAARRAAFVDEFGEYDKGTAARDIVEHVFRKGGRRG
jgi:CDP-glycerol glycerophosphotransferase